MKFLGRWATIVPTATEQYTDRSRGKCHGLRARGIVGPKAGENGFAYGVGGLGEGLPPGAWSVNTEKLGRRTIDRIEVEGELVTQTSADQSSVVAVYERWYSDELRNWSGGRFLPVLVGSIRPEFMSWIGRNPMLHFLRYRATTPFMT
jgi:hypothetical protein